MARAVERHLNSKNGPDDEATEPMPWPWAMADDCLDHFSGGLKHWPWPTRSWRFNAPALNAIKIVHAAHDVLTKPEEEWTTAEDNFYTWMHTKPEAEQAKCPS